MSEPGSAITTGRAPARLSAATLRAGLVRALGTGLEDPAGALVRARLDLPLWAPVALGAGIGAWFAAPIDPPAGVIWGLGALAVVALLIWARGAEPLRFPAALLALLAAGVLLAEARAAAVAAPVLPFRYDGPVEGRVLAVDRSSRDRIRLTLDAVQLTDIDPDRSPAMVRVTLRPETAALPEPGERVMLTANLQPPAPPAEPGAWDFRRTAWFEGLGAVGFARGPVLRVAPPDPHDRALAGHRLRMRLSAAMQARMPGQAGAVAAALMTGDRSGISEATNAVMRAANLYHIISISGLHMGMLAGFVFAAIRYGLAAVGPFALIWPVKKIAALVALVASTVYLWLAGAEVATTRAWLMTAVMLVAVLLDRRAISLRTVALAALVLLVLEPESLTEPGFQMSFAATVALVLAFGPWARIAPRLPWLVRPVAMLVLTSLVAGTATAPIAAAHFGRVAEYGLLANLLAVPVMGTLVMPAGVIAALLAPLGLAAPALWVMEQGTRWMIFVAERVEALDGAVIAVPAPPAAVLPLLALGALLAVLARGLPRIAGLSAMAVAAGLWGTAVRPALLIAPEGALVGLATAEGRALSKPGAAFVAESWLKADGDESTPEAAAARPGFSGPRGARVATWNGRTVVHLSGTGALAALSAACHGDALVILAASAPDPAPAGCEIWDRDRLRAGGVAFAADGRQIGPGQGARRWTGRPRRQ